MPKTFPPPRKAFLPFLALVLSLGLPGCAEPGWAEFSSLVEAQPFVLAVQPEEGADLWGITEITLQFSERLDIASLASPAVILLPGPLEPDLVERPRDFLEALESGEKSGLPLQFLLDGSETRLTLWWEAALPEGIYDLVVSPELRSVRGIPFNQSPGEATTLFLARYRVGDIPLPQIGETPGVGGPPPPIFGPEPESLVLQEFLYDGKVSETDGEAFVELFGTPGADISLYQILFLNGADGAETERITLPPGSLLGDDGIFLIADLRTGSKTDSQVEGADFLDQFDPQNGPDGLQLLNRAGESIDSVVYGEGAVALAANGFPLGEGLPAADVAAGHSLSRGQGVDSGDNGADFQDRATPSPGILD